MTPEEALALWEKTPAATPDDNLRAFAGLIFTPYPEYPRAMRMRRDDGTRQGTWHEVLVYDPDEAVNVAKTFDEIEDVYIIANPLGRKPVGAMAGFEHVLRVCWLPADLDAKNIEAEDKLDAAAMQLEELVNKYLPGAGYEGKPACGFTGNGYLALLRIDHPVDEPGGPFKHHRETVLRGFKKRFSAVDVTTTNAARLVRFLGTVNMSFAAAGKDGIPKRSRLITPHDHEVEPLS